MLVAPPRVVLAIRRGGGFEERERKKDVLKSAVLRPKWRSSKSFKFRKRRKESKIRGSPLPP